MTALPPPRCRTEPAAQSPVGERRPAGLRLWLLAVRPKTLTIALVPVLVGTALAWAEAGRIEALGGLAAAVAALLIQAATNLHNDAADFLRGGDTPLRTGPQRVTAAGWATPGEVMRAAQVCVGLSVLCGVYIIWLGGWQLLALGLCSLAAAWGYTGGRRPIAYTPLGELFVLAFFGWGAVGGTYWLHVQALSPAALVAGSGVGLVAAAVLLVNNRRDVDNDRRVGRRTLAVIAGPAVTKAVYLTLLGLPFALVLPLQLLLPASAAWLALLILPAAVPLVRRFLAEPPGPGLNPLLAHTARLQVLYGVALSLGLLVR